MQAVHDLSRLLANIPNGSWVALSHDEKRVIAHGPELQQVLEKAREAGEPDPIVVRVPEAAGVALL